MKPRDWELIRGFLLTLIGLVFLGRDVATAVVTQAPWNVPAVVFHVVLIALGIRALWPKRKA